MAETGPPEELLGIVQSMWVLGNSLILKLVSYFRARPCLGTPHVGAIWGPGNYLGQGQGIWGKAQASGARPRNQVHDPGNLGQGQGIGAQHHKPSNLILAE